MKALLTKTIPVMYVLCNSPKIQKKQNTSLNHFLLVLHSPLLRENVYDYTNVMYHILKIAKVFQFSGALVSCSNFQHLDEI